MDNYMDNKMNIVLIMTDQQCAHTSRREGFALDTTPFLDEFARQGAWFKHAYTTTPLCVPARISLLTGRYPSAHNICINVGVKPGDYMFTKDIFDVAGELGYKTALIGKNHSHLTSDKADHWYSFMHSGPEGLERSVAEKNDLSTFWRQSSCPLL